MAIKTKEEMFGDGGGFGTMVPVSVVAAGGLGAGNRGVDFGEQLTSAIANRTHYALALNDEDLDARLGVFETDGLDAAYRLGATATAGGGAVVTLDGTAIETQSSHTTEYARDIANAHYRANSLGDTLRGATGFEFVSDQDPEDLVTGTGWAAFMDRRAVGVQNAGFSSYFTAAEAVTLNPSGAGGTIVRLNTGGRKFFTIEAGPTPPAGNYTELRLGVDLIQLAGVGAFDGVYIVDALGSVGTDVTVRTLNGGTPAFTADTVGTADVSRIRFASIGTEFSGSRTNLRGSIMQSPKGGGAALDLLGRTEAGSGTALRVRYIDGSGVPTTGLTVDEYGRLNYGVLSENLRYDYSVIRRLEHRNGGAYASRVLREGSTGGGGEFAHMVAGADLTVQGRYDFASLQAFAPAGVSNLDLSIPFDFIAASPTNGRLDLTTATLAASAWLHLLEYGMVVEIVTGTGDTAGYYVLTTHSSGSEYVEVRELDHSLPAHFPGSGSGTLRFHACSRLGASAQTLANGVEGMPTGGRTQVTMSNVFVGGSEPDSTALVVMTPGNPLGTEDRAGFAVYKNEAGFQPLEIFSVMPGLPTENGYVEAYNAVIHEALYLSNSPFATAELLYGTYPTAAPRSRTLMINLSKTISQAHGVSAKWELNTGSGLSLHHLESLVNSGYGYIPLNDMLKSGMDITGLRFRVQLAGSAHGTLGDRFFCGLYYVAPTFAMVADAAPTIVASVDDGNAVGWLTLDPGATIGGGAHTVDLSTRDYYIFYKASVDGASNIDGIHAVELTVDDPGPRNF